MPDTLPSGLGSGPDLLRAAIRAAGITESRAAREVFGVTPASLSDWLSKKTRPRGEHREVAFMWGGVPLDSWDTAEERKRRDLLLRRRPAEVAAAPAPKRRPASKRIKGAPEGKGRKAA